MTLETLANLGEFIGGLVVVLSVIYLARQIRQNTLAQRTQNYAVALDRIAEFQARMSQSSEFADLLIIGLQHPERLSPQQRVQFTWAFYEMFGAFEFMFLQSQARAMPQEVWDRWAATLRWWMTFAGVRGWWDARPAPFTAAFTAMVDASRDAGPPEGDANTRWANWLQGAGVKSP
jgi:hypothetical protein